MKTVSKLGATLRPDEAEKLQNVSDLLDSLLDEFKDEVVARNGYVQSLITRMSDCDTDGNTEIAEFETNVTTLSQAHIDCRAAHHSEYQTKMTRYSNMMSWMANVGSNAQHTVKHTASLQNRTHGADAGRIAYTEQTYPLAQACQIPTG